MKILTAESIKPKQIFPRRRLTPDRITTICSAISSRRLIEFYYHGGFHSVEPCCLGALTPADGASLLCYQISGHSEFGDPAGWKLFRVSEITNLEVTDEHFTTRPGYNPGKFRWSTIYCSIVADHSEDKSGVTSPPPPPGERHKPGTESKTAPLLTHNELMRRFRLSHLIFPRRNNR